MNSSFLVHIGFIEITLIDIIDITLVTFLLYQLYRLMKGSIAEKIFLGILLIYSVYLVVRALNMELLTTILGQFIGVGVIAALILFQQEIRKFLLLVGKTTSVRDSLARLVFFWKSYNIQDEELNLHPIIEASKILSDTQTGALIVFAKSSELKFYAETGDIIDAQISKRLLVSIFQKNSPLHDGAVIIANQRVKAARCILPVSENDDIPATLGLRHRAAAGMSEVTDSVVMVVSEETGSISLIYEGVIYHNVPRHELRDRLHYFLYEKEAVKKD